MVDPATAKHQAPTHRLKLYVRAVIESEALPNHRRAIKEETIAINRNRAYNQACRPSHDIKFISNFFITFDNLFELRLDGPLYILKGHSL